MGTRTAADTRSGRSTTCRGRDAMATSSCARKEDSFMLWSVPDEAISTQHSRRCARLHHARPSDWGSETSRSPLPLPFPNPELPHLRLCLRSCASPVPPRVFCLLPSLHLLPSRQVLLVPRPHAPANQRARLDGLDPGVDLDAQFGVAVRSIGLERSQRRRVLPRLQDERHVRVP